MRAIRGGMGLGDAVYVQAVARHLALKGERVKVHTAWPDVFRPIIEAVELAPFTRTNIDILAHYSRRKGIDGTTQWEDVKITAGVTDADLRLDWPSTPQNTVVVSLPRAPMGRTDGFGAELLPKCAAIQCAIDAARDAGATIVQVGAGEPLYQFTGIDIDLANRTSVAECIQAVADAKACIGYVSFLLPLAEAMDKPCLMVWSSRGLRAGHPYVRQITPAKVLTKGKPSRAVIDTDSPSTIERAARALLC